MTEHFRSKPENATLDAHAFAPLDDIWEYTAIPVLDMSEHLDDGTPICGQFTYADGMAALKRLGLEPLTTYDVETLHDLATRGQCIELPAFTSTATAETSLAWRKVSDKANRDNMLRLGWKPGMRVCNFGKGWIAGAPAGRAWLMGWWVPRVEAYGITERHGPGFIQPRPMPGSQGRHGAHDQADDGTNLWGKRRRSDTATNPPSGSVVGSVVSAVASAAAQAADVLRGLLASDGAGDARPAGQAPHGWHIAVWEVVESARRAGTWRDAAGYEPQPGDAVILRRSGSDPRTPGREGHIGRVELVTASSVVSIDGNHANQVARVTRPRSEPVGYVACGSWGAAALDRAVSQLGVREATGHNDGAQIARYFVGATRGGKRTGFVPGWNWCAAFAGWSLFSES